MATTTFAPIQAGPAAALASEVRKINVSQPLVDYINTLLGELLSRVLLCIANGSQTGTHYATRSIELSLLTTSVFKKALLEICSKNNILAREAILEAELVLSEWTRIQGSGSLSAQSGPGELPTKQSSRSPFVSDSLSYLSPARPTFSRRPSAQSLSSLQIIADEGEDEDQDATQQVDKDPSTQYTVLPSSAVCAPSLNFETVLEELRMAIVHLSPLGPRGPYLRTTPSRITSASCMVSKHKLLKQLTPLFVLYASTALHHVASLLVKGLAKVVEEDATQSIASLETLVAYLKNEDAASFAVILEALRVSLGCF